MLVFCSAQPHRPTSRGQVTRRTRPITQQGIHARFGIAHLPAPDCGTAYPGLASHLGHGQPLGRQQDDPCALDMLLGTVPVRGNRS